MVVHLIRYGGMAEIVDGEGLNCLHIAAQFGLTEIMAYYVSCQTPLVREALVWSPGVEGPELINAQSCDLLSIKDVPSSVGSLPQTQPLSWGPHNRNTYRI